MNATTALMTTEMSESSLYVTLAVCVAQGGNLISILVSLPLSKVMDLGPGHVGAYRAWTQGNPGRQPLLMSK